jgi:hypothetical protein
LVPSWGRTVAHGRELERCRLWPEEERRHVAGRGGGAAGTALPAIGGEAKGECITPRRRKIDS